MIFHPPCICHQVEPNTTILQISNCWIITCTGIFWCKYALTLKAGGINIITEYGSENWRMLYEIHIYQTKYCCTIYITHDHTTYLRIVFGRGGFHSFPLQRITNFQKETHNFSTYSQHICGDTDILLEFKDTSKSICGEYSFWFAPCLAKCLWGVKTSTQFTWHHLYSWQLIPVELHSCHSTLIVETL